MSTEAIGRILKRAKELGLSPRAASLAAGMSDSAIRDLVRKPGLSPTMATLEKLAVGLQTTPEWLAYGIAGGDGLPGSELVESTVAAFPERRLVRASYGGLVEAGSFRDVSDLEDDPERPAIFEPADDEFPDAALVVFDASGDSMNDLKPRPILSGDRLVCLDFESLKNRVAWRDGMVVVVERIQSGGQLRERSVKQMEIYRDRTELCPRSTNPRHKPIVIKNDFEADDGSEVKILALVRWVSNRVTF